MSYKHEFLDDKNFSDERIQFLTDVLTAAVEGGIGYWSAVSDYRWDTVPADRGCHILDLEEPNGWMTVGLADIDRGIRLCIADAPEHISVPVRIASQINDAAPDDIPEAQDIDAELADIIMQYACFGEVIYG